MTPDDWYVQQDQSNCTPIRTTTIPLTRAGVKVFPASDAPAVEACAGRWRWKAAPTGADRSLVTGLKLPGEEDDFPLIEIGPSSRPKAQHDRRSQPVQRREPGRPLSGVDGRSTTLRGFGMAEDLDFGPSLDPMNPQNFGEPTIFPGGVSFGKHRPRSSGQIQHRRQR